MIVPKMTFLINNRASAVYQLKRARLAFGYGGITTEELARVTAHAARFLQPAPFHSGRFGLPHRRDNRRLTDSSPSA